MLNCVLVSEEVPYEYSMLAQVNKLWTFNKKNRCRLIEDCCQGGGDHLDSTRLQIYRWQLVTNWHGVDVHCHTWQGKGKGHGQKRLPQRPGMEPFTSLDLVRSIWIIRGGGWPRAMFKLFMIRFVQISASLSELLNSAWCRLNIPN